MSAGTGRALRRSGAVVLAGLLAVGMSGCASRDSDVDSLSATYGLPSTRVDLEAETWVLDRGDSDSVTGEQPATLVFDGDRVSGSGGCNAYSGDFDLDDDSVGITHISSTERACKPATMQAENEFFEALEAVDTIDDLTDDQLVLTNDEGARMVFRAFDAYEHLLDKWSIINVAKGGAIEGVLASTKPSITFESGGTVQLATGCNNASGDFTLEGDRLTVGPLRTTLMGCPEPGVTEQETALTTALNSVTRVEIAPRSLSLLNQQGEIALIAVK